MTNFVSYCHHILGIVTFGDTLQSGEQDVGLNLIQIDYMPGFGLKAPVYRFYIGAFLFAM